MRPHNEISLMNATHNYAIGLVTQLTTISSADLSSASDCARKKDIFLDLQSQKAPFRDMFSRLARQTKTCLKRSLFQDWYRTHRDNGKRSLRATLFQKKRKKRKARWEVSRSRWPLVVHTEVERKRDPLCECEWSKHLFLSCIDAMNRPLVNSCRPIVVTFASKSRTVELWGWKNGWTLSATQSERFDCKL